MKSISRQEANDNDPVEVSLEGLAYINGMKADGKPAKITPKNAQAKLAQEIEAVTMQVAEHEIRLNDMGFVVQDGMLCVEFEV